MHKLWGRARFLLAEVKLNGAQSWALPFCLHKGCLSAGDLSASASDNAEGSILQSLSSGSSRCGELARVRSLRVGFIEWIIDLLFIIVH